MKSKFILTVCLLSLSFVSFAEKFVLIPVCETNNLVTLFDDKELKIHYYCDNYVLATTEKLNYKDGVVLDNDAFVNAAHYAIVYCTDDYKNEYLTRTAKSGKLLYAGGNFLIMQVLSEDFMPAKNDGMVTIMNIEARLPRTFATYPVVTEQNEDVLDYVSQVSAERMMADIQTLQDFVTRNCQHSNIFNVRDWIKEQYDALELEVTLHNFPYFNNDNVIAIQYGTEFPDEYVVCGAHYDSFTFQSVNDAPGADDNASGTAGILETARILSQYKFKRSIIYCAFSAEEYGLYGSGYYAKQCASQYMNIVGYFNLDMTGYLDPEHEFRMDLVHYISSQPLANYYLNICDVYFPEIPVESYYPQYASSDYASFNNVGYMAIFPHEDYNAYNPYIHSPDDTIGISLNNPDIVALFTQTNVASIATLAMYDIAMPLPPLAPPTNCFAEHTQGRNIKITWKAPVENSPAQYHVYRDDIKLTQLSATQLQYTNILPQNDYDEHCYTVIAVYEPFGESDFSNKSCASVPVGIAEIDNYPSLQIIPNPTRGELVVSSEYRVESIEIFDVFGKKVSHLTISHPISISHLRNGIYFLRIQTENSVVTRKIIKN